MNNQINISPNQLLAHLQKARVVKPEEKSMPAAGTNSPRAVLPTRAMTVNPMNRLMYRGSRNIIEPNRSIDYSVLRRISEKAWLINAIIGHLSRQVAPFLKPSTDNNIRGFQIRLKDRESTPNAEDKDLIRRYTEFFANTGFGEDPDREDRLAQHAAKAIRDVYTLDQVTTELQRTKTRKVYAFWAIDPATILKCSEEGYDGNDRIKYIQQVQLQTTAVFTRDDLIFDYMNPRTDVDHSGYGYSYVEQAIELILAMINSFVYNSGFFTEDRLPRGMLLLQGDADTEEVEMMEDYLINIMSGGPGSKWRVPILPAGGSGTGGDAGRKVEWVSLQGSNKDMEFSQWTETIWSSVSALFGVDLEELGIKTSKSGSVLGDNVGPKIDASKARGLATSLSFLESHYQKILDKLDPRFDFEFMGYERDDPAVKNNTREADLRTIKSIDEIRVESGLKPFKQPWSEIPLNPYAVQLYQSSQQGGGDAAGGQGGDPSEMPGAPVGDLGGEAGDDPAAGKDPFSRYRNMITGGDDSAGDTGGNDANAGTGQKSRRSIFDVVGDDNADDPNVSKGLEETKKNGRSVYDSFQKSITTGSVNETIEIIV